MRSGVTVNVTLGAAVSGSTSMPKVCSSVRPVESATCTVTVSLPSSVGIHWIVPVLGSISIVGGAVSSRNTSCSRTP
jgi:hypothetical protein